MPHAPLQEVEFFLIKKVDETCEKKGFGEDWRVYDTYLGKRKFSKVSGIFPAWCQVGHASKRVPSLHSTDKKISLIMQITYTSNEVNYPNEKNRTPLG